MRKQVKKVAFVANTSWSIYNFRLGIIKKLISLGVKVVIVAPEDDYSLKLVHLGCEFFDYPLDNYGTSFLRDGFSAFQLFKIYRKIKPDFIFHYTVKPNIQGSLAAFLCNIPSIAVTTGLGHLFLKGRMVSFFSTLFYRLAARLSKEIWFLNQEDMNTFLAKKIVKPNKAFLLNSEGVNTTHFSPRFLKKNSNTTIFLYAGRIIKDKGIELLVEASKQLKTHNYNFEIHILGFIDERNPNSIGIEQLKYWETLGLIKYLGSTSDIRPFIAKSDCVVFPSFYNEGVSRILLEAASMAKPIITTNHVGCRDVVEDGVNGFLCEVKNVSDLVAKMKLFIRLDDSRRHRMGAAGRKRVLLQFDEEFIINTYCRVLNVSKLEENHLMEQIRIVYEKV